MKVEPVEYLVTFKDGFTSILEKSLKDRLWRAVDIKEEYYFMGIEHGYKTHQEALEALKTWKEKQDERR